MLTNFETTSDFNSRIALMSTIDLNTEVQPWCFTQDFWNDVEDAADSMEAADMVAEAFKACNGLVVIEAEGSYCHGKFLTIMDEFDLSEGPDVIGNWLLKRAFKKLDSNTRLLEELARFSAHGSEKCPRTFW